MADYDPQESPAKRAVRMRLGGGTDVPVAPAQPAPPPIADPASYAAGRTLADGTPIQSIAALSPFSQSTASRTREDGYVYPVTSAGDNAAAAAQARTAGGVPGGFDPKFSPDITRVFNPTGASALNPLGAPTYRQPSLVPTPQATASGLPNPAGAITRALGAALPGIATPSFANTVGGASTAPAPAGATSLSGKPLGYGATDANGTRVFSDGSNGIPRTITDAQITNLASRPNTISAANFSNPSDGLGPGTPALTAARPSVNPQGDLTEMNATSDLGSIFNEDPRSPLGIAARNAKINLGDIKTPHGRYGAGGASPYQQAIASLVGNVEGGANASRNLNLHAQQGATELANTGLRNQGELARENARSIAEFNRPSYQTDINGNLVRVAGTNAQSVVGADNKPLDVQGKINSAYEAAASKHAAELIKAGVDPDEAEERGIAFAQRIRVGQNGAKGKPTKAEFLKAAAAHNPGTSQADLEKYYDSKYGH